MKHSSQQQNETADVLESLQTGERALTVGEVAGMLRVSSDVVYAEIRTGRLHAIKVGRIYRVLKSEVRRYLRLRR